MRIAGDVPRAELFARRRVPGWSAWGNEVACDFSLPVPPSLTSPLPAMDELDASMRALDRSR